MLASSDFAQGALAGESPKQAGKSPIKVFILAGQSNMQGQGVVRTKDKNGQGKAGHAALHAAGPRKGPAAQGWVDANGNWNEKRNNVWVWDVNEFGNRHGVLEFGYGWSLGSREWFGPEMQFGHVMGTISRTRC